MTPDGLIAVVDFGNTRVSLFWSYKGSEAEKANRFNLEKLFNVWEQGRLQFTLSDIKATVSRQTEIWDTQQ